VCFIFLATFQHYKKKYYFVCTEVYVWFFKFTRGSIEKTLKNPVWNTSLLKCCTTLSITEQIFLLKKKIMPFYTTYVEIVIITVYEKLFEKYESKRVSY